MPLLKDRAEAKAKITEAVNSASKALVAIAVIAVAALLLSAVALLRTFND